MGKIYLIAEIGQAHEGSLGLAHSYIDALATTGVNAVKFQVHIAEAESSIYEPFRTEFSCEDKTRMDYWKRMQFSKEQWASLRRHCDEKKLDFIASPFSIMAIELLESIDTRKYKIGSGEMDNFLMLDKITGLKKPVILSSGMSSISELDHTINHLKNRNLDLSLLQCTSSYPAEPHQWGLNVMGLFKERYKIPVGFSSHSGDIYACLAAASLGAELLEFHVVFDQKMFGPDSSSSIPVCKVKNLVHGIRKIEAALNNPVDKNSLTEAESMKAIFGKSLAVNRDLPQGHVISINDLESKKPAGYGISAKNYQDIIGKRLNKDLSQWDFITVNDLV
ncbi:N-acetylneuraminate synthase family protein [Dyadobacter sediminis]|uniref:N-acetylneuraminate synthase n=1 Tax=Dyadobacter sediminis TaxID=1493691 RepID=A0A5R9K797_9BACT|nr:N-acetylneuraminate synthase family protein [Dyadobacter sediminis]TLU89737.1 N-acetylneuraminate synthase [Dyadobacter sediminis]GGC13155.1 N-acetylneuraminate synthase [Dyadobacter sediminis]